jgi:hypothetical protein
METGCNYHFQLQHMCATSTFYSTSVLSQIVQWATGGVSGVAGFGLAVPKSKKFPGTGC